MDIGIGSEMRCTDGKCGRVEGVTIGRHSHRVTDLLIKHGFFVKRHIVVPMDLVNDGDSDNVYAKLSNKELGELPDMTESELVPMSRRPHHHPGYEDEALLETCPEIGTGLPLTPIQSEFEEPLLEREVINTPPGTVTVNDSTQVETAKALVGTIARVLVDPVSRRATDLVVRSAGNAETITIPVSLIASLNEKRVVLKISQKDLDKLVHAHAND